MEEEDYIKGFDLIIFLIIILLIIFVIYILSAIFIKDNGISDTSNIALNSIETFR